MNPQVLASILSDRLNTGTITVENLYRITGGSSRATWSFDAVYSDKHTGSSTRAPLILRMGESSYGDALGASGDIEYVFYASLSTQPDLCVPKAIFYEHDRSLLGSDFFVVERIDGCQTLPKLLDTPKYHKVSRKIVESVFRLGGKLTRFQWQDTAIGARIDQISPEMCWKKELDYWSRIALENPYCNPLLRHTIDMLAASPPPPPTKVTVLAGDFRLGNFLFDKQGTIHGWLDWEMGHLGDPLEDLTWALLANWRTSDEKLPGGFSKNEAIAAWQEASDIDIDPDALRWWQTFQHIKAHGIWQAAVNKCNQGNQTTLSALSIANQCPVLQDTLLLADLEWNS